MLTCYIVEPVQLATLIDRVQLKKPQLVVQDSLSSLSSDEMVYEMNHI